MKTGATEDDDCPENAAILSRRAFQLKYRLRPPAENTTAKGTSDENVARSCNDAGTALIKIRSNKRCRRSVSQYKSQKPGVNGPHQALYRGAHVRCSAARRMMRRYIEKSSRFTKRALDALTPL